MLCANYLDEGQTVAECEPFVREGISAIVVVRLIRVAKINAV